MTDVYCPLPENPDGFGLLPMDVDLPEDSIAAAEKTETEPIVADIYGTLDLSVNKNKFEDVTKVEENEEIAAVENSESAPTTGQIEFSTEEIDSLYRSLGITDKDSIKGSTNKVRFEAIHIRGVEEMDTTDVFKYFEKFSPTSVEWINDYSCNAIWLKPSDALNAMLSLSKTISGRDGQPPQSASEPIAANENEDASEVPVDATQNENSDNKFYSNLNALGIPVPPGYWREGKIFPKAKFILLRFAYKSDKKLLGAEKHSIYYKKHGNPNFGGLRGVITKTLKRKHWKSVYPNSSSRNFEDDDKEEEGNKSSKEDSKGKLRMRMYADEEEDKIKRAKLVSNRKQNLKREVEEDENSDNYDGNNGSSGDLRTKLNSHAPLERRPAPVFREAEERLDLRSKLNSIRKNRYSEKHNPLVISVDRNDDDYDDEDDG